MVPAGRAAQGCRCNFRKTKTACLAGFDKRSKRICHFLDGCIGIAAMHIEQVHMINTKTGQAGIKARFKIGGTIVKIALSSVGITGNTSLGGDAEHIIALWPLAREKAANHLFGCQRPIDISRINMGDTFIQCGIQNGVGIGFTGPTIEVGK
ncbi:MAG: Uncharacterised protein [SAR116 cluster bacterium]|nr:MAG: Uncharacterised protein [SAR116 cluster bacterium]